MRFALFFAALVLAGCPSTNADAVFGMGTDPPPHEACNADPDCAPAAAKCCDCPTFAVTNTDPEFNACLGVACPMTTCPNNVAPACRQHECVLACVALTCTNSCADGFALDTNGCLSCDCAVVADRTCSVDTDCARVPNDCCGCALGGEDTAVPVGQQTAHAASLDCPSNPACPDVDVCAPDLAPYCIEGGCQLISGVLPGAACGRDDLPACSTDEVCTVNYDDGATARGVGVCVPAT